MIFRVPDNDYAVKVLREAGIRPIDQEELHQLFA